jgi:hypothetical protein
MTPEPALFVAKGEHVKATAGGVTIVYVGNTYERDNGSTVCK